MEAFPAQFCREVRSYWRRRKYQKLDGGKKGSRVARLGGGRGKNRRFWRIRPVFRIRLKLLSPVRLLARLRDAYVNAMLALAGKGSGLSGPTAPEALWDRRIPKARAIHSKKADFELRMMFEIHRALVAAGELTTS